LRNLHDSSEIIITKSIQKTDKNTGRNILKNYPSHNTVQKKYIEVKQRRSGKTVSTYVE
jgi:hypothetical protein